MIPEWFKIGASAWFMGYGPETIVISIDDGESHLDPEQESGSWVGESADGQGRIPLDEVAKYWFPYHTDFRKNED